MAIKSGQVDAIGVSEHYISLPYEAIPGLEKTEGLSVLKQTKEGSIFDFPFGNLNECVGQYSNLAVFVDTPLDLALARRIIRDYTSRPQDSEFGFSEVEEVSFTALDKELRFYFRAFPFDLCPYARNAKTGV